MHVADDVVPSHEMVEVPSEMMSESLVLYELLPLPSWATVALDPPSVVYVTL